MTLRVEQVAIIGVGLLGASLGLGLKRKDKATNIIGVGRNQKTLEIALGRGAVDSVVLEVEKGVANADLVCIATPAGIVNSVLDTVVKSAPKHAVVFDVASTKKAICAHACELLPVPRRFVGCHPMAGGEKSGPEHADPDLFAGAVCLVESEDSIDRQARERVCALWQSLNARVVDMKPAEHDAMVAATSHAPHVLAAAIVRTATDAGATNDFVGRGFLDVTRIAASRPELWRDICMENREALCYSLEEIRGKIAAVESLLHDGDAAGLKTFFETAVDARCRITES